MGLESFQVELRGGGASALDARTAVQRLDNACPDDWALSATGSSYYLVRDAHHVFEVEVTDAPVRVSCRFTLSHPASVDDEFLNLVRTLMKWLGMTARICDDGGPGAYSIAEFPAFADAARQQIARRRAEWRATFGDAPMAATTSELHQRVLLPRCQPGVG